MTVEFPPKTKTVVTVSEMARMVGLSRARFYQLIGSAFPLPVYSVATRRPIYVEELQRICLEVRRRNCGIDGKPILFYSRRSSGAPPISKPKKKQPRPADDRLAGLIEGVRSLGLTSASRQQVEAAAGQLYPNGVDGEDQAEVLRAVFVRLMRQNRGDNVG